MLKNSKFTIMTVIASLGIGGLTTTVAVASTSNNYQRLFRNMENNWIIRKADLESEGHTFSKVTTRGNIIEFSKTRNSMDTLERLTRFSMTHLSN